MTKHAPEKKGSVPAFLRDSEFDLPAFEEAVLTFWDEHYIFEKSLEKEAKRGDFVFYEGPPYANGKPAIHHVISRIVKDVILRYKTMQGYRVPRRAGWDTHGLPVEVATEKALGLKSKRDIEALGVQRFNEEAMKQVWVHKDEWERLTRRIGYWLDLKNAYVTYEPNYIESLWWTLSEIAKRGLLYKGFKVVPWCTRDGTALSSHELAQGYKEVTDTSVYVKFHLKAGQNFGAYVTKESAYIVSWTTTPWTLPGNVALAVGGDISYTALRVDGKELHIVASDLVNDVYKDREIEIVHDDIKGKDLVGLEYEPLFDVPVLRTDTSYRIYPADFVTTTDGTGVVHTAVMYGEDDYALGKKVGLPEHHTVNEEGRFTDDVRGFAGKYVKAKETEEEVLRHLESNGNLLRTAPYAHEYPFCWRCGTPILYYARSSWFIAMSKLRAELLEGNKTIHWMPQHVQTGRFGEWLKEVKDWNLSRERYWGAPLPIWECEACDHTEVVGSLAELDRLAGGSKNRYTAMRHGESENIIFGIVDSGDQHCKLTPKGRDEVAATAKKLAHEKIDMIFSSDLTRTAESAEIVGKALGVPVHFDKRLRELDLGALSGKPVTEYWKMFPGAESRFTGRPEGGESYTDARARVWDFIRETEAAHEGKNILIVTHETLVWMLSQIANGWSDREAMSKKASNGEADFVGPAEFVAFSVPRVPRNDTGAVDLHRPFADAIFPACPKCGERMKRVPEVADVWYDSGAMPYAQAHYPFSVPGADTATLSGLEYPADYIAEGMDQTRGWFYTLFAIATALGQRPPFKNVVALGLINDKFGQKMSKSKGNVVEPFAVIQKYGVDALRWYMFTGSPLGEPKNFDEAEIAKAFRRVHLIVYNSFVFWKTYADRNAALPEAPENVLDQWILARLDGTAADVSAKLDAYEIREAALAIEALVDDLSRWYIRRSRRRLQRPQEADRADHAAASATLGHVLLSLVKMMAPFTPFFSELFYGPLGGTHTSVHLDVWPEASGGPAAQSPSAARELLAQMAAARDFAAAGLAKRAEAGIKVRQPLASMKVGIALDPALAAVVAEEVNVKEVVFMEGQEGVALDTVVTPALRQEGLLRDAARLVAELRQRAGLDPKDRIVVMADLPAAPKSALMENEAAFIADVGATALEYVRSEKFIAEGATKIDGEDAWVAIRKA